MKMSPALSQYYDKLENGVDKDFENYLGPKEIRSSKGNMFVKPNISREKRSHYQIFLQDTLNSKICDTRQVMDALTVLFASLYSPDREKNARNGRTMKEYKHRISSASYGESGFTPARTLSDYIKFNFIENNDGTTKAHGPMYQIMFKQVKKLEDNLLLIDYDIDSTIEFSKIEKPSDTPDIKKDEKFTFYERPKRKELTF